jgi:menaquinone-dependent protoporphyrinogen oxidase
MTARVLVVHASRGGSTREIAERIAERLRANGAEVDVRGAAAAGTVDGYDAVVVGSAIRAGAWLPEATTFVRNNLRALVSRRVWLFSVGLKDTQRGRIGRLLGTQPEPAEVRELITTLETRGYCRFPGAITRQRTPRLGRPVWSLFGGRYGDFRDWRLVDAWADQIALSLGLPEPASRPSADRG